jgi:hypothetical protein
MRAPKGKSFDPVPAGNHVARLYQIIYLGTVPTEWQGQEKMTSKVRLGFELCNEKKVFKEGEEARPYAISREFTFSMGSKGNLRAFVEGMAGVKMMDDEADNFDLDEVLEGATGEEVGKPSLAKQNRPKAARDIETGEEELSEDVAF